MMLTDAAEHHTLLVWHGRITAEYRRSIHSGATRSGWAVWQEVHLGPKGQLFPKSSRQPRQAAPISTLHKSLHLTKSSRSVLAKCSLKGVAVPHWDDWDCSQYFAQVSPLVQAKTMGMKAGPASKLVVEALGLEGQMTGEQFLSERELILHKIFSSASLMPGENWRMKIVQIRHLTGDVVRLISTAFA